jgi:hypothetical protein
MRSNVVSRRTILTCGFAAIVASGHEAQAQTGGTAVAASAANPTAASKVKRVPISKAVFGDAGVIVNARDDGFIEIAAAGPKTVLVQLRTMAARGWLDSTGRVMRARPKRSPEPRSYRSEIKEYGSNAMMALTRTVTSGQSEYALYFADDPTAGFTVPIEPSEAEVFVAIVRKAVAASVKMLDKPDTTAKSDSTATVIPKKKPAVKRTAPPARPDTTKPATTTPKPQVTKPKQPA